VQQLPAWRVRGVQTATTLAAGLAVAGWTLTTGASYSLVSHFAHIRPVTAVAIDRPEVGILIDAPGGQIPQLASRLSSYGIHVSFGVGQTSSPVDTSLIGYGDQALPRLPTGGLVRWLGTRGELHHLVGTVNRRHFLYMSSGPSLGQWLFAHGAGGRLVAGAVRLQDGDDSLGDLRPGEVVEVTIANPRELAPLLGKLLPELRADHLSAVSIGRLMRDARTSV